MKQTEHYQLSQWELSDRLLMEDFNRNHAAIDTALHQQATALHAAETVQSAHAQAIATLESRIGLKKLFTQTLGKKNLIWKSSLSQIDWSQYRLVHLLVQPKHVSSGSGHDVYLGSIQLTDFTRNDFLHIILFPSQSGDLPVCGLCFGLEPLGFSSSEPFRSLTELQLQAVGGSSPSPFQVGSSVTVYGEP